MTHITGIVLAAGCSRRMGRAKQLLVVDGRPLLRHALDTALASRLDDVIVVLGHAADEIQQELDFAEHERLRWVRNPRHEEGQSTSIAVGLEAVPECASHVALLLADQPDLDVATVDRVLDVARHGSDPVTRTVWEQGGERVPGHPVVFARRCWPELAEIRGDRGARDLLAAHPDWIQEVVFDAPAPADLDRPEDLRERVDARRTLG